MEPTSEQAWIAQRFRGLLDAVPDAMLIVDRGGRIRILNERAEQLFGYARGALVGEPLDVLVPERLRRSHASHQAEFFASPRLRNIDSMTNLVARRANGTEVPVDISLAPIETEHGPLVSAAIRDATARRLGEARYRGLVEGAHDAMLILREDYRILEANRATERLLGLPRSGIIGQDYLDFVAADERADAASARARLLASGALRVAGRHLMRRGERVPVDISASVVRFDRDVAVLFVLHDVSDLQAANARLRDAERRLDHVVSSSPAVLYTLRLDGEVLQPLWVSRNIEDVVGYAPSEVVPHPWFADRVHPEDRDRVLAALHQLRELGHVEREFRFRHKDGRYVWIHDEQRLLRDPQGKALEIVGAWWNVEDRKRAELRLEESERQYRLLFDANPHPMWVYDRESLRFLAVNDAAVTHYGFSRDEFLAMTIKDIRPAEDVPALLERIDALGSEAGLARSWRHRLKDGTLRQVEVQSRPIDFKERPARLVLATDVTERQVLETQLRQAQKMEAIGQLAGGVAHDFNNLLGVILGNTSLLERDADPNGPSRRRSAEIRRAAERAAALTRQLLAFSRRQVLETKVLDPNDVVAEVEVMLRRLIGEDVRLAVALGESVGYVKADPGQIQQVVINLAVNARDAMPQGGRLAIETSGVDVDEAYARSHPDVRPGRYVLITVSDSGHGMDAETQRHLFEPFFTTKAPGRGTGLGLATVFGIVKQSGGHVTVYSEVGRGSTFRVYLPRVDAEGAVESQRPSVEPAPGGRERVLVVEDAEPLRAITEEILSDAGYLVWTAVDPDAALELLATCDQPPDLLLTDIVMPGMSGRTLAGRVRSQWPRIRVLFMSGYADPQERVAEMDEALEFIGKPFTADALLRKVRSVLDAR